MPTSHNLASGSEEISQWISGNVVRTLIRQLMALAAAFSCLVLGGCEKDSAQGFKSYSETDQPETADNLQAAQTPPAATETQADIHPGNTGSQNAGSQITDSGDTVRESSAAAETGGPKVLPAASSTVSSSESADPESVKPEPSQAATDSPQAASPEAASSDGAGSGDSASTSPASDIDTPPAAGVSAASSASETTSVAAPADTVAGNSAVTADPPPETPAEPRTIELLIPEKQFRTEKNTKAIRISYDDIDLLKVLNMEPVPLDAVNHFPAWLKALDGTQIRIRGFMFPTYEATGLTAFTLARDNGICCFVRQPKIYDIIEIEMAPGKTSDYIDGKPFDVEGTFRIQPEADDKTLYRLYRVENARVLLR